MNLPSLFYYNTKFYLANVIKRRKKQMVGDSRYDFELSNSQLVRDQRLEVLRIEKVNVKDWG